MNLPTLILRHAPAAFALCAGFLLIPAGRAQPEPQIADNRFLFIFDTSAEMKKRLPAVQAEVNQLMSTGLRGQLRPGDSVGVWTFDQDLHTGQFPLQSWRPENAVTIAAGINKFVGKQKYANKTRFDVLQPQLNQVIRDSGRLTVLIFCDGADEIKGTPYDARINQVFQQRTAEQKRTRQPFVLVFRTQLGQYTGCTMNFPPGMVNIPEFPPPPAPPAPVNPPPPEPPPAPVVKPPVGPPLVIIGTKVQTNWPPASETSPPPPTNPAPVAPMNVVSTPAANVVAPTVPVSPPPPAISESAVQTNVASSPSANLIVPPNSIAPPKPAVPTSPTNPVPVIQTRTNAAPVPSTRPTAPTNAAPVMPTQAVSVSPANPMPSASPSAPSPEAPGPSHKSALAIGGALLMVAGGLAALAVMRSRRAGRGSLITRSMRKD
jgi:hypothetical protein